MSPPLPLAAAAIPPALWLDTLAAGAEDVTGIKLIAVRGEPQLLFSRTPVRGTDGVPDYYVTIYSVAVAKVQSAGAEWKEAATRLDTFKQMLPAVPRWDVHYGRSFEITYEEPGGALSSVWNKPLPSGQHWRVSDIQGIQSFRAPHFARVGASADAEPAMCAFVDQRDAAVFERAGPSWKWTRVVVGANEGLVGGGEAERWVLAKNLVDGPTLLDALPGQLSFHHIGLGGYKTVLTGISYEFDAAVSDNDIVVFATGVPATITLESAPNAPVRHVLAKDQHDPFLLSSPTLCIIDEKAHLAALAHRSKDDVAIVYHTLDLHELRSQG